MANIVSDSMLVVLGIKADQKSIDKMFNNLKGQFKSFMTGLAAGAGFVKMISDVTQLANLSTKIGESVEDIQAWSNAIESLGGNASDVQGTLTSLSNKISTIDGKMFLSYLGVNTQNASKALESLAGRLEGLNDIQVKTIGDKLGIDPFTLMTLKKGKGYIQDLLKEQRKDVVITKEDVKITQEFHAIKTKVFNVIKKLGILVMRLLMPAIRVVSRLFFKLTDNIKEHPRFWAILAAVLTATMIPALTKLAIAAWAAVAPMLPMIAAITAISAVAAILAVTLDDLIGYVNGEESALEGLWDMLVGPEGKEGIKKWWKDLKQSWDELGESLKELGVALKPIGTFLLKVLGAIAGVLGFVLGLVISGITSLTTFVMKKLAKLITWIANLFTGEMDWDKIWDGLKDSFENVKKNILGRVKGLFEDIKAVFGGIGDFLSEHTPDWIKDLFGKKAEMPQIPQPVGTTGKMADQTTNNNTRTVTQNNNVNISVNKTNATAQDIGHEVKKGLDRSWEMGYLPYEMEGGSF